MRPFQKTPANHLNSANLYVTSVPRTFLIALGLTSVYCLFLVKQVLEPTQYYFYHWSGSAASMFVPVIANFIAFWLLLTVVLLIARKQGRVRVAILTALVLLVSCVYTHLNIFYHRLPFLNLGSVAFVAALLTTCIVTAIWRPDLDARYERVLSKVTTILTFLGFFGLFILFSMLRYGWQAYSFSKHATLHQSLTPPAPPRHRIIWIIFDELSQDQVYTHRFPGLQLPAFDSLAATSTQFTNVIPADINTENVIPGMIMGRSFGDIKTSSAGIPRFYDLKTRKWELFNQYDSVFQDALHSGYSTAVVGWFNPYCRILSHVLDHCSWPDSYRSGADVLSGKDSALSNTLTLTRTLLYSPVLLLPFNVQLHIAPLFHLPPDISVYELHIHDYLDINSASDGSLRDPSESFLFLHFPIPHPQGIYNRKTGAFASGHLSSYVDNLALADKSLAHIRATLEQTGQWDSSTIVIMGDHGWRTKQMWRKTSWVPEDELASRGGQYDPHPAYLVKLPGQSTSAHFDLLFPSVNTRALFDQLMTNQITTPAELSSWAETAH